MSIKVKHIRRTYKVWVKSEDFIRSMIRWRQVNYWNDQLEVNPINYPSSEQLDASRGNY